MTTEELAKALTEDLAAWTTNVWLLVGAPQTEGSACSAGWWARQFERGRTPRQAAASYLRRMRAPKAMIRALEEP